MENINAENLRQNQKERPNAGRSYDARENTHNEEAASDFSKFLKTNARPREEKEYKVTPLTKVEKTDVKSMREGITQRIHQSMDDGDIPSLKQIANAFQIEFKDAEIIMGIVVEERINNAFLAQCLWVRRQVEEFVENPDDFPRDRMKKILLLSSILTASNLALVALFPEENRKKKKWEEMFKIIGDPINAIVQSHAKRWKSPRIHY